MVIKFLMEALMNCPRCGSENLSTERRLDGVMTCLDCGHKERNVSQSEIIICENGPDRAYRGCLCCVCNEVSRCTPTNDFYTTKDHGNKLVCEKCFHEYLGHKLNGDKSVSSL